MIMRIIYHFAIFMWLVHVSTIFDSKVVNYESLDNLIIY
jgi:hypothetical protein